MNWQRLIFVDDDKTSLRLYGTALRQAGFEVLEASDGQTALALMENEPPDLVITDALMPDMDGFDLCRRIKGDPRLQGVPVILCTATYTEPQAELLALSLGVARFMLKPGSPDVLVAAAQQVLAEGSAAPEPLFSGDELDYLRQHDAMVSAKLEAKVRLWKEEWAHRTRLESEARVLGRLYALLTAAYQTIVLATSEADLLARICQALVEGEHLALAWVGVPQAASRVMTVASASGQALDYLEGLEVTTDPEDPHGQGPTGICIREDRLVASHDWSRDDRIKPWLERGHSFGIRASIAIPLKRGGLPWGALNLYAYEAAFFTQDQISLLETLGQNLGLALDRFEQEQQRRKAEQALEEREHIYRSMLSTAMDAVWLMDASGRLLEVNEAACGMLGYSREELLGCTLADLEGIESPEATGQHIRQLKAEGKVRFESLHRRRDGSLVPVEIAASCLGETDRFVAFIRDVTARKEAEEALLQSEARFRTMLRTAMDAIWLVDREFKLLEVNDAACRMLGYSRKGMVGMSVYDIDTAQDSSRREQLMAEGSGLFETLHRRRDGTVVEVEIASTYLDDAGLFVACIRDISQRKASERAMREFEARAQGIIQTIADGIALVDQESLAFIEVNQAFCDLHGWSREELLAKKATEVSIQPEETLRDLRLGTTRVPVRWHEKQDGTVFPVEILLVTHTEDSRRVVVYSCREITDRIQAEAHAANRQIQLQNLLDLASMGPDVPERELLEKGLEIAVALSDSHIGFLHFVHPDQETLELGIWSSETLLQCTAAFDKHYPVSSAGIWADALRRRQPCIHNRYAEEPARKGLPGGHFPLNRELVVPVEADGLVRLLLGVGNRPSDYTEDDAKLLQVVASDLWQLVLRKRAEGALREANTGLEAKVAVRTRELQSANQDLEAFAYSVSHDLRAPLRHAEGYLRMLDQHLGDGLDPKGRHFMEVAVGATQRMAQLIEGLLAFSRMGKVAMKRLPVDLGALVRCTIPMFEPETRERRIRWEIGELPTVLGDPTLMQVLVQNLLANAVKFTRQREEAVIRVQPLGGAAGEVGFLVADNGAGFDPKQAGRLFSVFQRLHREEDFEGTGIGLANVRRAVERHGGRVWAEGAPGEGATFHVLLPGN